MKHDPIAHDAEPAWVTCQLCDGDGCTRDTNDLHVTCTDCLGDGGWER
jgi:DnaJ-class molecular chaperone